MNKPYQTYQQIQIGEPDANSEFFSSLRKKQRAVFLDSFYNAPTLPLSEFKTGSKYLIYGQKGIGKTSVLRYLQDKESDDSVEFLIFKKALLEEIDLASFTKIPLIVDEEKLQRFKHYHHLVKRMLIFILINKLSKKDATKPSTGEIPNDADRSLISKIFGIDAAETLKLSIDTASDIFDSLGIKKTTNDKILFQGAALLKKNNDTFLKYLTQRARRINIKIRVYLDEIHFAYRNEESLQQDAMLVRDTILAVQSLNDRFAEENIGILLYLAVRSEYLEHPIISTADINQAVESVGFELTYSNFPLNKSHPLFDLILLRFRGAIRNKSTFFNIYLSGMDPDFFLKRTWSKPRDIIRFFSCAKELYPNRANLSTAEQNTVWRNYSQKAWREIMSAASPFLPPAAISRFEITLRGITPGIYDGSERLNINNFSSYLQPVYEIAKGNLENFYDFDHFLRLLYILGIFSTRRRDAFDNEIFHSYHRGNRNFHIDGAVLIHPTVLKALG